MAKKSYLGIDIGYDNMKLALVHGDQVKKTAVVQVPQKLIKEGRVVSPETMGELIRDSMKKYGIRCHDAALVLPNESVFIRNVTMPQMTAAQLEYNLPFEFRDYISDETKNYVFDYAMISTSDDLEKQPDSQAQPEGDSVENVSKTMDIIAVAVQKAILDESRAILRKAGLRLAKAAPTISCYVNLIRWDMKAHPEEKKEYCILDLGYHEIRMYMFKEDRHIASRILEMGLSNLDERIADAYNVDVHLAHTYLLTNHDNCQTGQVCMSAYSNIAVELMRALNFYRFSNPDTQLSDIWLCGGGAAIEPLRTAIAEQLDMQIHLTESLVPGGENIEECFKMVQAIGITLG